MAPCNEPLEAIEIERVALPIRRRFVNGIDTYGDPEDEEY